MAFVDYQDKDKFHDVHIFNKVEEFWMFHLLAHSKTILSKEVLSNAVCGVKAPGKSNVVPGIANATKVLEKLFNDDHINHFSNDSYAAAPTRNYTINPKFLLAKLDLLYMHLTTDVAESVRKYLDSKKVDGSLYYAADAILHVRRADVQRIPPIYTHLGIRYPNLDIKCGLPYVLSNIVQLCGKVELATLFQAVTEFYTALRRTRYGELFVPLLDTLDKGLFEEAVCYLEVNRVVEVSNYNSEAIVNFRRKLAVTDEPSSYNMLVLAMVFNDREYINDVYREPEKKTIQETAVAILAKHMRIDTGYPVIVSGIRHKYRWEKPCDL